MILARYITKQILLPFFLIMFVLLLIMISITLTNFLGSAVIAVAGFEALFLRVVYKIPGLLREVMPVAFFLAAFMGIGRMYTDIEMHVLFACGISKLKLLMYALIPTLIIMSLAAFSENIIRPYVAHKTIDLKNELNDVSLFDFVVEQTFTPIGDTGEVMYVSSADKETDVFEDVFIAQLGQRIIKAKSAKLEQEYVQSGDELLSQHFLNLKDGTLYLQLPGDNNYSETQFEQYRILLDQEKPKASDNRLKQSTVALFKLKGTQTHHKRVWFKVLTDRLFFPMIFLGFLPWALFLAQTPARKSYYWKLLPLIVIYSIHGSGASYLHEQWFAQHLSLWLGKWYWDIVLCVLGLAAYFLPQWFKKMKAKRS